MGIEAVQGPVGVRPLTVWKQREQSMVCVAGVLHDFPSLPFTPPDIEVLNGSELSPSDVLGCPHHPLQSCAIEGGAIAIGFTFDCLTLSLCGGVCVDHFKSLVMGTQRNLML